MARNPMGHGVHRPRTLDPTSATRLPLCWPSIRTRLCTLRKVCGCASVSRERVLGIYAGFYRILHDRGDSCWIVERRFLGEQFERAYLSRSKLNLERVCNIAKHARTHARLADDEISARDDETTNSHNAPPLFPCNLCRSVSIVKRPTRSKRARRENDERPKRNELIKFIRRWIVSQRTGWKPLEKLYCIRWP